MRNTILILLLILTASCSSMQVGSPDVTLVNLKFGQASLFETVVVLDLRMVNEHSAPVKVTGGVHRVYLNGIDVGKGTTDEQIEIPALGSVTQKVVVHMSNLSLLGRIRSIVESQRFDYRIDSTLYLKRGFSTKEVRITREGKFDFKKQDKNIT